MIFVDGTLIKIMILKLTVVSVTVEIGSAEEDNESHCAILSGLIEESSAKMA